MEPPTSATVIWVLTGIVAALLGASLAMFRVLWGAVKARPEEVLAAAQARAAELQKTVEATAAELTRHAAAARQAGDEAAALARRVETDVRLLARDVRSATRGLQQFEVGARNLADGVNDNRVDIAQLQGTVGHIQEHLGWTPLPKKTTRRGHVSYPAPTAMPPADTDDGEPE